MRALVLVFALAACSQPAPTIETPPEAATVEQPSLTVEEALARMPNWDAARAAGVDFRGVGQEPGWIVDIYTQDRIRLTWDYGESTADFPLPTPAYPQEGATRYESTVDGRTLTVTIRRFPCQDAMSGEAYPSNVEVMIDGRTLNGCGRSV
ncbi:hypothetical protein [Terricaulis sp.]|uniref:COG3650 family protein n=1 Tax=Terricaulis sp. TaxID=2768686 RepID=UPI002AC450AC|nr:hypothetical protein [Terricaulis sp.]MDZ4690590.1 hypothetical protein [Terricaulis sp.]